MLSEKQSGLAVEAVQSLLKYYGLTHFKVTSYQQAGYGPDSRLLVDINTELNFSAYDLEISTKNTMDSIHNALQDVVFKNIENSTFVSNLTQEHEQKIEKLQAQINELKNKVDELAPFKIVYDLNYKMKHGEKNGN